MTTDYTYDRAEQVLGEFNSSGLVLGRNYLGEVPVAIYYNNTTYFVHRDHLGSTRILTTMSQGIADCYDYFPFGQSTICGSTAIDTHMFTGKEHDASGLDNFGGRYYSSTMERFATPDWSDPPKRLAYGDPATPQSLDLYAYVEGNPTSATDPEGHFANAEGPLDTEASWGETYQQITGTAPPPPPPSASQKTKFKTAHAAEVAAEKRINPKSIKEKREYAGWIVKNPDGTYSIVTPHPGTETGSDPGPKPANASEEYHTHGAKSSCMPCDENFSPQDIHSLRDVWNIPGVLGTPSGAIKLYDPASAGPPITFEERTDD